MGNELSATENAEGNEGEAFENGIQAEPIAGKLQNGGAHVQPIEISVSNDVADCKADVKQNTELSSSQKTMEMSSSSGQDGNNAGKNAKKTMPAAKSLFSLSFSTPVPVRSEAPTATDSSSSSEPAKPSSGPENPPANQFTAEKTVHPQLPVPERESVKAEKRPPSQSLLPDVSLKESKEAPKPKEIGFFDKLFKTSDKEKESSKPVDETEPELSTEDNKGPAATATANEVVQVQLNNAQRAEPGEGSSISVRLQNSQSEATDRTRDSTEDSDSDQDSSGDETASEDNPVMNFFKTLVSPSKSSKSDSESQDSPKEKKKGLDSKEAMAEKDQKPSKVEKGQASLPVAQQLPAKPETQPAKEQEPPGKQKTDKESSPSPFSKLFRQKSMKEGSQAVDTKANQGEQEAEAASDIKAVKAVPSQSAKEESKGTESAAKSQKSGQAEGQQEGQEAQTQQKPAKEATASPFSKLFKQKTVAESQTAEAKVEVDAPATTTVTSNTKTAENSTTAAKEGDESKPAKSTFMSFFKPLSVREEEKVALEVNGKDSDQTRLDSKSKATAQEKPSAAPEAKEKAPSPEVSKKKSGKQDSLQKPKALEASQDSKSVSEASQNGEESTKDTPRRLEKRPSIGGFFKGLGSKRMSDVGVQTDPVCISPAQKSK